MPLMDGIEATARIRTMPGGTATPIVGTTSGKAPCGVSEGRHERCGAQAFSVRQNALHPFAAGPVGPASPKPGTLRSLIATPDNASPIAVDSWLVYNEPKPFPARSHWSAMSPSSEADRSFEDIVFEYAEAVSGRNWRSFLPFPGGLSGASRCPRTTSFVGVLQPDGKRIATLAVHGAVTRRHLEYELAGTPCADVVKQQVCSYPSGVQQLFPQDKMLAEISADGYVGSPMVDSSGRCLGLICAITKQPLENPKLAEALLGDFRRRARAPNWSARTMKTRWRAAKSAFGHL